MPLDQKERECAINLNLNTLPDDVLFAILGYCDRRSLCVLSRVSKNLYRVARDDSIWRRIALRCVNVHPSDRNLMPWIQLGRPQQLFVAQAADVILYQKSKRTKSQSSWQPLMTFSDHQGDVSNFLITEGQLVTCGMDKSIRTWSLKTGLCDGLYLGHSSDVHSVDCFGEVIVTGSRDKTVKVWSQQSKSCVHTIHVQDNVWAVSLNPSTRSVVSGSSGHTGGVSPLQLWDIDSGRLVANLVSGTIRPGAGVRGIKWETPYTLLSCGYDTNVRLWDTRLCDHSGSSCVLTWEDPHDSVVYCVDSDRKWMVISGTNRYGVVRIWDKRFRKCLQMYYAGRNSFSPVYSLSFNRTSLFVALASGVRMLDFTV
ncbi:F-box/WD repeat-containing protein 4-like isoform X2 [Orbicella faveolata]|uniref:F-box/WD repeat-containing protein 4-like isoform X2 n=1 Tax=Orbicella faveolata TaxID=48498 RepID=UPI0009E64668|nr:F-box/WD repeat-containing protein 4-like isoform X2 [Orbicella faveolata]